MRDRRAAGLTVDWPVSRYPSFRDTPSEAAFPSDRSRRRLGAAAARRRAASGSPPASPCRAPGPATAAPSQIRSTRAGTSRTASPCSALGADRPAVVRTRRARGASRTGASPAARCGASRGSSPSVERVGPGDLERHEARVVDPRFGDLLEQSQLRDRGQPQLEPGRPHAQARERMRRAQEQLPLGRRPRSRASRTAPSASRRRVPRGRRDRRSRAPRRARAGRRAVQGRGRDRRRACSHPRSVRSHRRCAELAVRGDGALDLDARSNGFGIARRSGASPRRAARRARSLPYDSASVTRLCVLGQRLERHLADDARVDEPVGFADVRHHDVVGRVQPSRFEPSGEVVALASVAIRRCQKRLHQRVRLARRAPSASRRLVDAEVVRVVDVRDRVVEQPDAVRERHAYARRRPPRPSG